MVQDVAGVNSINTHITIQRESEYDGYSSTLNKVLSVAYLILINLALYYCMPPAYIAYKAYMMIGFNVLSLPVLYLIFNSNKEKELPPQIIVLPPPIPTVVSQPINENDKDDGTFVEVSLEDPLDPQILAKQTNFPYENRRYKTLFIDDQSRRNIDFIMENLTGGVFKAMRMQDQLKEKGRELIYVHPYKHLEYILTTPANKNRLKTICAMGDSNPIKKNYFRGFYHALNARASEERLDVFDHLDEFAKAIDKDKARLKQIMDRCIAAQSWKEFVEFIIR